MSLASLLLTADGSPAERARLADVQIETLDLLSGTVSQGTVLSPTLRLAAVRQAMVALHRWCPSLREAEKAAAEDALCLASASLDLTQIVSSVGGGPDFTCDHARSAHEVLLGTKLDSPVKVLQALAIKRHLLSLTAALEREADSADIEQTRKRHERAWVEELFSSLSIPLSEPVAQNPERSQDSVLRFLDEARAALEAVAAAAASGDVAEVALRAHELRGRSADFAALTLAALCLDLERRHNRRKAAAGDPSSSGLSGAPSPSRQS